MDEKQAAEYLNQHHSKHFTTTDKLGKPKVKIVTQQDIKRWYAKGRIGSLTESILDEAIKTKRIPPKRGRPSRYTGCDKEDIIAACKYMTRGDVAKKFKCSRSYVSLIARGKR